MEQGDSTPIYQRPLTEEGFEGVATLVRLESDWEGRYEGRLVQRWQVRFAGESETYSRSILTQEEPVRI